MKKPCTPIVSRFKHVAGGLILAATLTSATAEDLFNITARSSTLTNTVSANNLIDLVKNIVGAKDEFSAFQGTGFDASLKYAGVENAIKFNISNDGKYAKLTIPSTGLVKEFNGNSRDEVEDQMEDYLKKEGSSEYSKFLKSVNKQSTAAVSDGNPNSSTATFAAQNFNQYAFAPGETRAQKENPNGTSRAGFSFYGDIGTFDADGIKGTAYSLPLSMKVAFNDRVALGMDLPLSYIDLNGASIFGVGGVLSLPVKVIVREVDQPWLWQVTPSGGALVSASYDMLAGGLQSMVGGNSMLSYDFPNFTLGMGNGLFWFEGVPLSVGGVDFDPGVSQQILKNGLKVSIPFYENWIAEVYGIHTKFLQDAGLDQYFTFGGEIGWKPNPDKKRYWTVGAYTEIGDNFTAVHGTFGSNWKF